MANIVAANVSYSFDIKDKSFVGKHGFRSLGTITFGDGSLTYPAAGIPLTKGKLGCPRVLKNLKVIGSSASGYQIEFDSTNVALRLISQNLQMGATSAASIDATGALAKNSAGTQGVVRIPNTVASTNYDIGKLAEIGNIAFPAITVLVEVLGY